MVYIDCNGQTLKNLDEITEMARRIKVDIYGKRASFNPFRVRKSSTGMMVCLLGLRPGPKKEKFLTAIAAELPKFTLLPPRRKNESDEHLYERGIRPAIRQE